jgi:hypothetical protein
VETSGWLHTMPLSRPPERDRAVYCIGWRIPVTGLGDLEQSKGQFTHTMLFPCCSAKALDCVFPIWFTQFGRVWFTHTMPFPCHAMNMPFWKRPLKAMAGWQHVGNVPVFGLFQLPRGVPGSLLSEAYQSQMQVASVKQRNICHVGEEAYYFGAMIWVLV